MIHVRGTRIRSQTSRRLLEELFSLGYGRNAQKLHRNRMLEITKRFIAIDSGREETGNLGLGNGSMISVIENHFRLEGRYAFINETIHPPHAPCAWLIRGPLAFMKHEHTPGTRVVRGARG